MKKLIIRMTLGVLLILGTIGISHASLIGDEVNCSTNSTEFECATGYEVVGGGNEFTLIDRSSSDDLFDIDILGTSFTISENFSSPTFEIVAGTLTLSSLDWLNFPNGYISGVSLIGVAGVTGLDILGFTNDSVTLDLSETSWSRNSRAGVRLAVSHGAPQFAPLAVPNPTALAVPEPTTLALFGIGLAGMGFARKKRKST